MKLNRIAGAVLAVSLAALGACDRDGGAGGKVVKTGYPDCRSDDLALKLVSEDAKTSSATYRFENRSRHICTLKGFARVTLVGADGRPLEAKVTTVDPTANLDTGVKRRPAKVVLRPQRRADFSVGFPAAKGECRTFVKITATPPASDWGLDVAQTGKLCGDEITVTTFWYDSSETL